MRIIKGDIDLESTAQWGGKANGLLRLLRLNYLTPSFYILPKNEIQNELTIDTQLDELIIEWIAHYKIDREKLWAVRSSAMKEDGLEKSFAGQYLTELNISYNGLKNAIKNVLNSYKTKDVYKEETSEFSVIIQEMIPADYSGVIFSKHPQNILSDNPILQILPGLGDRLVSGELDGFTIETSTKKIDYKDLTSSYGTDQNQETGEEIRAQIGDKISELVHKTLALEKYFDHPVDIEFALYEDKIYWLQVRPITNRPKLENYRVWDKTAAETSYPEITLPLSATYTTRTFEFAYHSVDKTIGYAKRILAQNKTFISQMSGEINGHLFYNVTAWQSIIYQMPFGKRISAQLPDIWGMNPLPFPKPSLRHNILERTLIGFRTFVMMQRLSKYHITYESATQYIIKKYTPAYFNELSHHELITNYRDIEKELDGQWFAPMATGFYAMVYYNRLKKKLKRTEITTKYPNFLNDILMQDGEVISVEIVRAFQHLLNEIYHSENLSHTFKEKSSKAIFEQLKNNSPDFFAKVTSYIQQYGCRTSSSELKMETITYREDPVGFIKVLKVNIANYTPNISHSKPVPYEAILKEIYPYKLIRRKKLARLIKKTITKTKARENYRFMRTETFAVVRSLILACGNQLYLDKKIDAPRDVLYLNFEDLLDTKLTGTYREIIRLAQARYAAHDLEDETIRFVEIKEELYPIQETNQKAKNGTLSGIGCCSGMATGTVKIIRSIADLDQDFSGCIVIAKYFEPGWINVFSQANGIISERGNLLSHTAIISRELGIPSIVGMKGIIEAVQDIESVKINGAIGIVYL